MSGFEPILIGAALGGASSAAMGKNPIQGALLGGLGGGVMGAASAMGGAAAGTGIGAGGAAIPGVMGAVPASVVTPGIASSVFGGATGMGATGALPGIMGSLPTSLGSTVMPNIAASSIGGASIPLAAAAPSTFGSTLANIPSAISQGVSSNPNLAMAGLNTAKEMMQQQPVQFAPAGQVNRGQQMPQSDYMSLLNPQQSSVLRPQPISLL